MGLARGGMISVNENEVGGGGGGGGGRLLWCIWATERSPMLAEELQVVKFFYSSEIYALHQLLSCKIKTKIK